MRLKFGVIQPVAFAIVAAISGVAVISSVALISGVAVAADGPQFPYMPSPSIPGETNTAKEPLLKEPVAKESDTRSAVPARTIPDLPVHGTGSGAGLAEVSSGDKGVVATSATSSVAAPPAAPTVAAKPATEGPAKKLRFKFTYAKWQEVLDWFAKQSDLSLEIPGTLPTGTFNYTDSKEYTPAEAISLLNSVLQTKGFILVRRDRMLTVINLEDPLHQGLFRSISPSALDSEGEYEMVTVTFPLAAIAADVAEVEVRKLLGPQGTVVALQKAQQLIVTDTGGRLRAVRALLKRIDPGSEFGISPGFQVFSLKFARMEDVLPIVRQLLEIPEDKMMSADGSIRVAIDSNGRLIVSGRPEKVGRAREIVEGLDVATPGVVGAQFESIPLGTCDPQVVLTALQVFLGGQGDVRLAIDSKAGNLLVMARPNQLALIRAVVNQIKGESAQFEVFHLSKLDPQQALLSINKLFGSGDPKLPTPNAPQIDADPNSRQLMVRGTEIQITQIRELLTKLGEDALTGAGRGHVRNFNFSPGEAQMALEQVQGLWPKVRPNPIRVMAPPSDPSGASNGPSALQNLLRPVPMESDNPGSPKDNGRSLRGQTPPVRPESKPESKPENKMELPVPKVTERDAGRQGSAGRLWSAHAVFVADIQPVAPAAPQKTSQLPIPPSTTPPAAPALPGQASKSASPIIIFQGANGLTIFSEDIEALDEFERLLNKITEGTPVSPVAVFYLKNAKAATVAETLEKVLSGLSDVSADSKDLEALKNSLARKALTTGSIKITPDPRLNALFVQANRADQDTIEQILKTLDRPGSPLDVTVSPRPKLIPIKYARAKDVAEVVREIYANRLSQAGGGQQQGGPGGFLGMMMRGGGPFGGGGEGGGRGERGGGGGGGGGNKKDESMELGLGVDNRTNSLVVLATEVVFKEVEELVSELDVNAAGENQAVGYVVLRHTSPATMEKALASIGGETVVTNGTGTTTKPASPTNTSSSDQSPWSSSRRGGMGGFGGGAPGSGSWPGSGGGGPGFGGGGPGFGGGGPGMGGGGFGGFGGRGGGGEGGFGGRGGGEGGGGRGRSGRGGGN